MTWKINRSSVLALLAVGIFSASTAWADDPVAVATEGDDLKPAVTAEQTTDKAEKGASQKADRCGCGKSDGGKSCDGKCGKAGPLGFGLLGNSYFDKRAAAACKPLYYDNDFSYLCDPGYCGWHLGEGMKRIGVTDRLTVDAGGEYRFRAHSEGNLRRVPLTGFNDDFALHRVRLYLNAEYGGWLRFYGEAIDAQSNGARNPARFIEQNRFDALNLFADVKLANTGRGNLWVRGGRQELLYGAQRLVSPLDWSNTRRTFDGVKFMWEGCNWDVDFLWSQPVPLGQHGSKDTNFDQPNSDQEFSGFYATYKALQNKTLDMYYLRYADYGGTALSETAVLGDFDYNLLGARLSGSRNCWLYEVEGGFQFGDFSTDNIQAGFATLGVGRKLPSLPWSPVVWGYYDFASGDLDPTDGTKGTFNHYFPLGHKYLGWMDIIGRQNIQDLNAMLVTNPAPRLKFIMWYHIFHLAQNRDALYNAGGAPIFHDPTGSAGGEIGSELDLLIKYAFTPRMDAMVGYSHFWAGDYFNSPVIQGPAAGLAPNGANGKDADFFYFQFSVRF